MATRWGLSVFFVLSTMGAADAAPIFQFRQDISTHGYVQFVATCKSYTRCEQAVRNWCEGSHPRADGDNDGIPCENVCRSRSEVREIQRKIGCSR